MNQVSDALAGSALALAQSELAAKEIREMFQQRCAEEKLNEYQVYELIQAAKVAIKCQLQGGDS